jgi:hypothetical protein
MFPDGLLSVVTHPCQFPVCRAGPMTRLGRLRYIANGVGRPLPESIGDRIRNLRDERGPGLRPLLGKTTGVNPGIDRLLHREDAGQSRKL